MTRRRKSQEAPIETLFKAPWWVSVAIAVVILIGLKWVLPSISASNMLLKPLATVLSGFAWLFSGVFLFVGILSFAREKFFASRATIPAVTWSSCDIAMPKEPGTLGGTKAGRPGPEQDRIRDEWKAAQPAAASRPTEWSIELLRELEWKRFEDVCQKFYESKGIKSGTTPLGPDGGIDIRLYQDDSGKASSIVQCKAWGRRNVGVKPVRELLGVMAHEKVEKAFFMASGNFTDEAKAFAQSNRITLINGEMLVTMIKRLPDAQRQASLVFATEGDFTTPTCPSCGIKMRRVPGTSGRPDFWGCQNYPPVQTKTRNACRRCTASRRFRLPSGADLRSSRAGQLASLS